MGGFLELSVEYITDFGVGQNVNWARLESWRGVCGIGYMTPNEECCMIDLCGYSLFCIYLGACSHRTATAAKHANKETFLEHAFSRAV